MSETCGHQALPRRLCDVCFAEDRVFMACSLACLERHQLEHAALPGASERARHLLRDLNARYPDSSDSFTSHRERLMELLVTAGPPSGTLAVFGAGNGADLELSLLTRAFSEVHLIDLDGDALERARSRQPAQARERLVLHPGLDLSGFLEHIDDYGEAFPAAAELVQAAVKSARGLVQELGTFDVTLSACVLSQLGLPFRRSWVAPASTWSNLTAAMTAVHLATLAGCTRRRGVLAFDAQSSKQSPMLEGWRGSSGQLVAELVEASVTAGVLALNPEPSKLLSQLSSPGLAALVSDPELSSPWLWDLGEAVQLVYAISFQHP
jgi:hypothetical protein